MSKQLAALSPEPTVGPATLLLRCRIAAAHEHTRLIVGWSEKHIPAPKSADHRSIGAAAEGVRHVAVTLGFALERLERELARTSEDAKT